MQFCTRAFASYARLTAADLLFGVQVENLMGLNYFFQVRVTVKVRGRGLAYPNPTPTLTLTLTLLLPEGRLPLRLRLHHPRDAHLPLHLPDG